MSERLKTELASDAMRMAYWRRKPAAGLIAHSDPGVQYASGDCRKLLSDLRIRNHHTDIQRRAVTEAHQVMRYVDHLSGSPVVHLGLTC